MSSVEFTIAMHSNFSAGLCITDLQHNAQVVNNTAHLQWEWAQVEIWHSSQVCISSTSMYFKQQPVERSNRIHGVAHHSDAVLKVHNIFINCFCCWARSALLTACTRQNVHWPLVLDSMCKTSAGPDVYYLQYFCRIQCAVPLLA